MTDSNPNDFWEYDQATNVWTRKADFGGIGRSGAVGFSVGIKVTSEQDGMTIPDLKDFWEYDQVTNVWTKKADFGGTARRGAVGFSIGTKGYIGTGYNLKDFWEYDQTTTDGPGKPTLKEVHE